MANKPSGCLDRLRQTLSSLVGGDPSEFDAIEPVTALPISLDALNALYSRSLVWEILTHIERYPEWNPYHVSVEGELALDEPLTVRIEKPNGERVEIQPHVIRIAPRTELTWGGGIHGIFFGEHVFLLESKQDRMTHRVHNERFAGIAVPFASLGAIDEGYILMNQALKQRAEQRVARQ